MQCVGYSTARYYATELDSCQSSCHCRTFRSVVAANQTTLRLGYGKKRIRRFRDFLRFFAVFTHPNLVCSPRKGVHLGPSV